MVQGDSHGPNIAPLVIVFFFDNFRGETERCADDFFGFDVAMVIEDSGLGHVAEFDGLEVVGQQ